MNELEEKAQSQGPVFPVERIVGLVPTSYPPPHASYLVVRNGVTCTATPCYGMHKPWWVVRTLDGEAPPVEMRAGDEWQEAKPNAQVHRKR